MHINFKTMHRKTSCLQRSTNKSTKENKRMVHLETNEESGYLWDEQKWLGTRKNMYGASKETVLFKLLNFEWHHFLNFQHCLLVGSLESRLWDGVSMQDFHWSFFWDQHLWKGEEKSRSGQREKVSCEANLPPSAKSMVLSKDEPSGLSPGS